MLFVAAKLAISSYWLLLGNENSSIAWKVTDSRGCTLAWYLEYQGFVLPDHSNKNCKNNKYVIIAQGQVKFEVWQHDWVECDISLSVRHTWNPNKIFILAQAVTVSLSHSNVQCRRNRSSTLHNLVDSGYSYTCNIVL